VAANVTMMLVSAGSWRDLAVRKRTKGLI